MTEPIDHVTANDVTFAALEEFASRVWTQLTCRLISYNETTQKASVRVVSKVDGRGIPDIHGRPVLWPSGGDGALTFPFAAGDPCVLCVLTLPTDEYQQGLNIEEQVTTQRGSRWRFDLSNSYVQPGGPRPFTSPLPPTAHAPGATVLSGFDVRLGDSTAVDLVALATLVGDRFDELKAWITATLSPAIIAGSAVTPPPEWIPNVPSTAATLVKAK